LHTESRYRYIIYIHVLQWLTLKSITLFECHPVQIVKLNWTLYTQHKETSAQWILTKGCITGGQIIHGVITYLMWHQPVWRIQMRLFDFQDPSCPASFVFKNWKFEHSRWGSESQYKVLNLENIYTFTTSITNWLLFINHHRERLE